MRKIILLLSLSLFSLALLVSCASTEPVESQSPVEPPPANPRTIQGLILAGRYDEVKESLQIQRDIDAVENAVAYDHSNGFVEGTNSRLKMIKRTMYGRCGRKLLEAKLRYKKVIQNG